MLRHAAQSLELLLALGVDLLACIGWAVKDFGCVDRRIEVVEKSTARFEPLVAGRAGDAAVWVVFGDGFSR